ncbi:hypothetical protein RD792_007813 [Penstemon davidsonii]|uniref:DED domain-containing protein n=1 Tax=Penstemon davidsonii TaxID=160366 RepID=A0ABR0D7M0_9LAMI|nr:hypothetical protein RD792_007813 [Penstemon davidsonii]
MRKENPQLLSPQVFVVLMRGFASARMVKKAIEVLNEMPKYGCEPDEYVFGCLLDALCKNRSVKEAALLVVSCRFNITQGNILQFPMVEVCDYFKEMVERGLLAAPQYGTLKDLLNSLLRSDKLQMAEDVWSCIVSKGCELNVFAWTIWIHALFSNVHVKDACSY